jgi:hypothetical protein
VGEEELSTHGHQVESKEKKKKEKETSCRKCATILRVLQAQVEYILLLAKAVVL